MRKDAVKKEEKQRKWTAESKRMLDKEGHAKQESGGWGENKKETDNLGNKSRRKWKQRKK